MRNRIKFIPAKNYRINVLSPLENPMLSIGGYDKYNLYFYSKKFTAEQLNLPPNLPMGIYSILHDCERKNYAKVGEEFILLNDTEEILWTVPYDTYRYSEETIDNLYRIHWALSKDFLDVVRIRMERKKARRRNSYIFWISKTFNFEEFKEGLYAEPQNKYLISGKKLIEELEKACMDLYINSINR